MNLLHLLTLAFLSSEAQDRPEGSKYALDLVRRFLRSDALRHPSELLVDAAPAKSRHPQGMATSALTGRQLQEGHHQRCAEPFQMVGEGESCSQAEADDQVNMCKPPLRCVYGRCARVRKGDDCRQDGQCDGQLFNLDMVCVRGKCDRLHEAGEVCSHDEECFSKKCDKGKGICTGKREGEDCAFGPSAPGRLFDYQNPCGEGLHCSIDGASSDGQPKAKCRKPAKSGDQCFQYSVHFDMNAPSSAAIPDWFVSGFVSSVYAACEPAHICEVDVTPVVDAGMQQRGSVSYVGTCRRLLHGEPGSTCHSPLTCKPPYTCDNGECGSPQGNCGSMAQWRPDAGRTPDQHEEEGNTLRRAGMQVSCATNERCSCPGGVGKCFAIHEVCASEELRLLDCMEKHQCPFVDFGDTQCVDDHCKEEDVAYECCKYRGKFNDRVDWEAMQYYHGEDVRDKCSHLVTGVIRGLPRHGDRVWLELNGRGDLKVEDNGAFTFGEHLNHLDRFNVTVTNQPKSGGFCNVLNGSGVAIDDIHDVEVICHVSGAGGAIAAAVLIPCFVITACIAGAAVVLGKRSGGGAREGFVALADGARQLPQYVPPIQNPFARSDGDGPTAPQSSAGQWVTSGGMAAMPEADMIPQAQVIDAATGQPVVQATAIP